MKCQSIGSYFAPAPYIRESAPDHIWGANGVVVTRPAPMADHVIDDSLDQPTSPTMLLHCAMVTARMNRVYSRPFDSGVALAPHPGDRLRESLSPLAFGPKNFEHDWLFSMATQAGVPRARVRSDQAWVGGRSPLESKMALPASSLVPSQLSDLHDFLQPNQASKAKGVAEAAAYQLLTIHPLADGNGRTTRMLLVRLALTSGVYYPLYFA